VREPGTKLARGTTGKVQVLEVQTDELSDGKLEVTASAVGVGFLSGFGLLEAASGVRNSLVKVLSELSDCRHVGVTRSNG
jgi:hypothetical protein